VQPWEACVVRLENCAYLSVVGHNSQRGKLRLDMVWLAVDVNKLPTAPGADGDRVSRRNQGHSQDQRFVFRLMSVRLGKNLILIRSIGALKGHVRLRKVCDLLPGIADDF